MNPLGIYFQMIVFELEEAWVLPKGLSLIVERPRAGPFPDCAPFPPLTWPQSLPCGSAQVGRKCGGESAFSDDKLAPEHKVRISSVPGPAALRNAAGFRKQPWGPACLWGLAKASPAFPSTAPAAAAGWQRSTVTWQPAQTPSWLLPTIPQTLHDKHL